MADLVAHTRMKTPTAVAEFLISGIQSFEETLTEKLHRIVHYTEEVVANKRYQLDSLQHAVRFATSARISESQVHLSRWQERLRHLGDTQVKTADEQLRQLRRTVERSATDRLKADRQRLDHFQRQLQLLDPQRILQRGYSITYVNGKQLRQGMDLQPGDHVTTRTPFCVVHSTLDSSEQHG